MNNEIDEKWINLKRVRGNSRFITAISNTGKYRKSDGTVGCLRLRQQLKYEDRRIECYRIIAEHFLITVKRPDQNQIDHITHNPKEYNVNDVRNLRWCNNKENHNFEEAKQSVSGKNNPMYGMTGEKAPMYGIRGNKHPMYGRTGENSANWKGCNVTLSGEYKRGQKLYKAGKLTEDEFQHYRDLWSEYQRNKRHAKKEHSSK